MVGENKLVLFGAGKIGRSFIGQLFGLSGYEVVFVDINNKLIDELNAKREYKVIIKSDETDRILLIKNVRGVHFDDAEKLKKEFSDATLSAISVGQQGLTAAIELIAQGLINRYEKHGEWPIDIIIAENMRNADSFILENLKKQLPGGFPVENMVGLIETSIGKMVPIMSRSDMEADRLQIFAESYNSLIVAKNGFKNPIPDVKDLAPKENIKAWVDRKLFIHNLGHAVVAYLGFKKNPQWIFIFEALEDREVFLATRHAMLQSAAILVELYPEEFTVQQLEDHIDDLLKRFQNKALGDTIFRVGCDLYRKLSADED
jgi:mannitol-1-phosphate 5-dehydrogenase